MDHFIIKKEYVEPAAGADPLQHVMSQIYKDMPDDLKIAMAGGCQIDITIEGHSIKIKTRYPISILKDSQGRAISLIEKKQ